jgi:GTP:adenosylcobinamide-phosphate guanylyltransferase
MDEIEKRQLINDVNTIADAELTKKLLDSIPVARANDFFNKLKDLEQSN